MDVGSLDQNSVTLAPHEVSLLQSKDMTLFEVTDIVLVNDTSRKTGIRMTIKMKRKIMIVVVADTQSDSIQCLNFAKKMIHSIFDSILFYPRFNSKYYSIRK